MSDATAAVEQSPKATRNKIWHNIAVRLADEGVPTRAIVRALMITYDDVVEALKAAKERGMILNLPRDDWPPGTRRDERQPDTVPLELEDEHMVMLAIRTFNLTPTMGKIFVALMRRPEMTKNSLHVVTRRNDGFIAPGKRKDKMSDTKIVDVYICKMRTRLPKSIPIETMWGCGYYIPTSGKEAAFRLLGIKHDTFAVPAKGSKGAVQ